jgi:hypothetical protein
MSEKLLTDPIPTTEDFAAASAPVPRAVIEVTGGELHRWIDETWEAVVSANDPARPEVMAHGNDLVRLSDHALAPFNVASLREQLSRVAVFVSPSGTDGEMKPKTPPKEIADALLAREPDELPGAARIERITDVPLVTRTGDVLDAPGYYADHSIYYEPADGLENLTLPGPGEVETTDEVDAARDFLLNDWFGEFGFADEASRANALAALLTPFVREFIHGGVPLFPLQAAQWGWGKTTGTDACFIPGCGTVPKAPGTASEEEMRKRITSTLRSVPSAVVIDNFSGHLESGSLANVLTSGVWEDRILGESRTVKIKPRCVWSINGNNFTMSAELVERCPAPIQFGPGAYWSALCERKGWDPGLTPRQQPKGKYDHPDYRPWAEAHRADAVHAAFVLIRHWLDGPAEVMPGGRHFYRPLLNDEDPDGQRVEPVHPDQDTGEFPEWQRVVGGILKAAGVEGFGENYTGWSSTTDDEGEEIGAFYAAWRALNIEPCELKVVIEMCSYGGALHDLLPTELAEVRSEKLANKLKAWLRERKGTSYRGYRLVVQQGRGNLYSVIG